MIIEVRDYVAERGELLRGQVQKIRETSVESVREACTGSAESLKALKSPVRMIARSSVKLSAVSQEAVQNLIELQSDVVTAALTDVAVRLERATKADSLIELVREQIELTPATRDRIVEDATRAVTIVRTAGREIRAVAVHAYETLAVKTKEDVVKPARRKAKAVTKRARKTVAKARKTVAAEVAA